MGAKPRVLVIEDDRSIALLLTEQLGFEGFDVEVSRSAEAGLERATAGNLDLIILDVMLPDGNGFEVCTELRRRGVDTPLLMLTARGQAIDKVRGLNLGADDYLTKPFDLQELVARLEALRRRARRKDASAPLRARELILDPTGRRVTRHGTEVSLTKTEFDILQLLLERNGQVVSRNDFLDRIWPESYVTQRTIDTHIASLRRKIETGAEEALIETIRGIGYRFDG